MILYPNEMVPLQIDLAIDVRRYVFAVARRAQERAPSRGAGLRSAIAGWYRMRRALVADQPTMCRNGNHRHRQHGAA